MFIVLYYELQISPVQLRAVYLPETAQGQVGNKQPPLVGKEIEIVLRILVNASD